MFAVPVPQESTCHLLSPSRKSSREAQLRQWGWWSCGWDDFVLHCAGWSTAPHCSVPSAPRAPCSKSSMEYERTQIPPHPRKENFPALPSPKPKIIPSVPKPPSVGCRNYLQLSLSGRYHIFMSIETQITHFEVQALWINLTLMANGDEFDFRKNLSFRILPEIWAVFSEILSCVPPSQILKSWEKSCTFYLKLKWQVTNSENLLHQVVWKLISESSENLMEEIFSNSYLM